jgi:hypothetical protein
VTITNTSTSFIDGAVSLVLDNLPAGVSLVNKTGVTQYALPSGSPFITFLPCFVRFSPGQSTTVLLKFKAPSSGAIT